MEVDGEGGSIEIVESQAPLVDGSNAAGRSKCMGLLRPMFVGRHMSRTGEANFRK